MKTACTILRLARQSIALILLAVVVMAAGSCKKTKLKTDPDGIYEISELSDTIRVILKYQDAVQKVIAVDTNIYPEGSIRVDTGYHFRNWTMSFSRLNSTVTGGTLRLKFYQYGALRFEEEKSIPFEITHILPQ